MNNIKHIKTIYEQGERPEGLSFSLPSRAHQSFAKEAEINTLVSRYLRTGTYYDQPGSRAPQFGDFTDAGDFQDIQDRILRAKELFSDLPSDLRLVHQNDPSQFLAWLADPENAAEAAEMGLIEPSEPDPKPDPTPDHREDPSAQDPASLNLKTPSEPSSEKPSEQSST